jgi:flagellum-specific ATP synthase
MRIHGAMQATSIAEYFRDQGKNVLLLMDSLTRFAQAQREIALAIGEPPATKGYPPSVFARLPQLVERAGNGARNAGSITAFYTVLVEGDDHADPIADAARAILDGHIVLSRQLAETGIYPAIDIEASISRLTPQITTPDHMAMTQNFRGIYSLYQQNRDLISVGAYQPGSDPTIDRAVRMHPQMIDFISQNMNQSVDFVSSREQLFQVLNQVTEEAQPAAVETMPQADREQG